MICISGGIEIGLGDGTTHTFGPGDARLVEDTTGKGQPPKLLGRAPGHNLHCAIVGPISSINQRFASDRYKDQYADS
ncbi:MAG: hypothetical protein CM1200mP27_07980 [Chloroflexota bacterium]|nr:MAG: hypothetical protein CM1200mP27_07980 [Chloroflexota bacterium]